MRLAKTSGAGDTERLDHPRPPNVDKEPKDAPRKDLPPRQDPDPPNGDFPGAPPKVYAEE
jgi:hypothetical protein